MPFQPYDPECETIITRQNLPHWRQDGVTYFVTSRLADSMPAKALAEWKEERQSWLQRNGVNDVSEIKTLPEKKQHEFQSTFTAKWHRWLDAGYGDCALKEPDNATILVGKMLNGHSEKYRLDAWVIMPNHFHALLEPVTGFALGKIMQQWKGASARMINAKLHRQGTLWQDEPFDHIVRSEEQLNHYRRYIAKNPGKAGLSQGTYTLGFGKELLTPDELENKVAGTSVPDPPSREPRD